MFVRCPVLNFISTAGGAAGVLGPIPKGCVCEGFDVWVACPAGSQPLVGLWLFRQRPEAVYAAVPPGDAAVQNVNGSADGTLDVVPGVGGGTGYLFVPCFFPASEYPYVLVTVIDGATAGGVIVGMRVRQLSKLEQENGLG